ncbi:MAG: MFS transporter [Ignavibacteriae bacterium]|nr:MFS transporter [Ignavibacteriota bacterium]NOG98153.1 MFS transporter [Ignavibacteriota bacterium]
MKLNKIPRQVIILGMVSFFTDFASEMLYPVTPLFLTGALGASMITVGVIEGFAEVIAGFLKGYFGVLSDRLQRRSIFVVIGYSLSSIVKPLPGIFPFLSTVIVSRISDRVGKGIRTSPRDALLASHSNGKTGSIFGFHRSMDTLGAVVGPLAALGVLAILPGEYTSVYLFAIIPSIFAIGFTFIVKDVRRTAVKTKSKFYKEFWSAASREYKILLVLLSIFSIVNSSDVFLILKSKEVTGSDTIAIFGYVFYNIIYALISFPMGVLADKIGKKLVLVFGLIIFSAVYFGFALNSNIYFIWFLFALYGIFSASTEGIAKAWVSDLTNENFRGSAIGLLNTLTSLGIMAGSIIAGYLWDAFGAQVPFLISGIVSLIVAVVLGVFSQTNVKESKHHE